ncbi:MAG: PAS domain S-box protein [Candidatus Accumulibacter adjunctus]|uniref:PAS domain S-box protein n=1 Tax=Candidatus Accumulibacter adjunctus TaxID=1454001 RepID=A0A011PLG6_9PROT|nr:MAG: PAS domain S-box protein [Candidatus Accumulibacter adjunctus]
MNATSSAPIERQLVAGIDSRSPWATVLEQAGVAVAVLDADFSFVRVSPAYASAIGRPAAFFPGRGYFELFPHAASEAVFRQVRDARVARAGMALPGRPQPGHGGELERWNWSLTPFAGRAKSASTQYLVLTIQHPAAQRAASGGASGDESGRFAGEWRLRRLFESLTSGFALHEIVLDAAGKPCDYRFLEVNVAFEAISGLERSRIIGRCASAVFGEIDSRWLERFAAVALDGDCGQFDDYHADLDRHYRVTAYCPEHGQIAAVYDDVTTLRTAAPAAASAPERPQERP